METAKKGTFKLSEYVTHCFRRTVYSPPREVLCNLEFRRRVVYMVQFCMQMENPFFQTFVLSVLLVWLSQFVAFL